MVGVDIQESSRPSAESYKYLFKVTLIGPASVGKSAIVSRFADESFTLAYSATIGVDFKVKNVEISNNEVVKLQMWDTAGQERFRVISHSYYRGAHGILLVFDISKESTFQSMYDFYTEVKEKAFPDCSVVLIGTKSDLKDMREVSHEQAEDFASKNGITYVEVSSKTGDEVSRAFQILIEKMMKTERMKGTSMSHALVNKAKAKTAHCADEDSLHELENKSTMLESARFKREAKKSGFCTIL